MTTHQPQEPMPAAARPRPASSPNAWTSLGLGIGSVVLMIGGAIAAVAGVAVLGVLLAIATVVTGIVGLSRREPEKAASIIGLTLAGIMLAIALTSI